MSSPSVVIVSPSLAVANNGNWQTARRWQALLRASHRVRITQAWPDAMAQGDDVMLALHARRSADSVQAWSAQRGSAGLAVVLTGTDLYRDIAVDASARLSLELAAAIVLLQDLAPSALPPETRARSRVIYQSTTPRRPLAKGSRTLRVVMVGHLRQVKEPQTLFEAARMLPPDAGIRIRHIGEAGEPELGAIARLTARDCPHYEWMGALPHNQARREIQRAHVLVHTSAMEGGAHVIMEAVCSATPVLASRVDGNVGMLGDGYQGYFPFRDAGRLATLLMQCRDEQQRLLGAPAEHSVETLLETLRRQCAARAPLFSPDSERAALLALVSDLAAGPKNQTT